MFIIPSINDPQLIDLLLDGHVGVLPTDTIYGLVALASDQEAVKRLYSLKHREQKPGTVVAANVQQLVSLGLDEQTLAAAAHLWPNPISIIVPCKTELNYLDLGKGSLAVRIPDQSDLNRLLEMTGPLLTSSANHPGEPQANNPEEAEGYFGDAVDFYVNGGDLSGHPPSTVARLTEGHLEVLRQGAVAIDKHGNLA